VSRVSVLDAPQWHVACYCGVEVVEIMTPPAPYAAAEAEAAALRACLPRARVVVVIGLRAVLCRDVHLPIGRVRAEQVMTREQLLDLVAPLEAALGSYVVKGAAEC